PDRSELLEHYERVSGLSTENIDYYLVLANWKLGIVLEKSYATAIRGNYTDEAAEMFKTLVPQLIATAAELTKSLPGNG
nr:acyl-CoA dehydrogenase [Streptomyces sp. DSM 41633]